MFMTNYDHWKRNQEQKESYSKFQSESNFVIFSKGGSKTSKEVCYLNKNIQKN